MAALNTETALLATLAVAVAIIALVFAFSSNLTSAIEDVITGGDEGDGLIDCDPQTGENCRTDTDFEVENEAFRVISV